MPEDKQDRPIILGVDNNWHQYVLNHCTKYLARANFEAGYKCYFKSKDEPDKSYTDYIGNHNYFFNFNGANPNRLNRANAPYVSICEAWRFPVIDSWFDPTTGRSSEQYNRVTFVYPAPSSKKPNEVRLIGTFGRLYEPIPLKQVLFLTEPTDYFALTILVPKGQVHYYRFIVDDEEVLDPVNPQWTQAEYGQTWSRFFTHYCSVPLVLERWEMIILRGLVSHILPFRTQEAQSLLNEISGGVMPRQPQDILTYHLNQEIGVVNFIDKLLAKEENYNLTDYQICLTQLRKYFKLTNPETDLVDITERQYEDLYTRMAANDQNIEGWEYEGQTGYSSPLYFLQLLRRQVFTGAFSHPKYGGNVDTSGWEYLEETFYKDGNPRTTLFNWRRAIEYPLGKTEAYRG